MGKKILVPCLDVIMIAFSSLVLEIWSFTVYFSGKRRSLLERLRFTFTANGKRQTQVENFSE